MPTRKLLLSLLLIVLVSFPGCKCFEPSLKPTVKVLRDTIKDMREKDYEKGRVVYSSKEKINADLLAAKIERLKEAENNAAIALGEPAPHKPATKKAEPAKKEPKKAGAK